MKSFIKIAIIFFSLATTLLLGPLTLQAQELDTVGYIQNVKNETVVLVSNSLCAGEIYSNNEENNQNYSGSSPIAISFNNNDNFFVKNTTLLKGCFIHNLSTDKQKVHQIRAP